MFLRRTFVFSLIILPGAHDLASSQAGKDDFDLLPFAPPASFYRMLKTAMIGVGIARGGAFSPHCFRRGAAQELEADGGAEGQTKSAGRWSGTGVQSLYGYSVSRRHGDHATNYTRGGFRHRG